MYKQKYLKYKLKYLNYKKKGGMSDATSSSSSYEINNESLNSSAETGDENSESVSILSNVYSTFSNFMDLILMAHRELNNEQINKEISEIQREEAKIKREQDQEMLRQEKLATDESTKPRLLSPTSNVKKGAQEEEDDY